MKTFVYKGTGDFLVARDVMLTKDVPFTTDDPAVIALLSSTADVEEVNEKQEDSKKPSRKPDAVKS